MDKALELKMKSDQKEIDDFETAVGYLTQSTLFQSLVSDFKINTLNLIWRLTQLSEIPFSKCYPQAKQWRNRLVELSFADDGYSLTGKRDYILPCYNAMITSLLIKFELHDTEKIKTGIDWILEYQNVKRNENCRWPEPGVKKYGGCLKSVPCYIGVVKSMTALSDFKHSNLYHYDKRLESKLGEGLEYILQHELFKRMSDGKPITSEITKITFPFSYKINIIELLRLMKDNDRLHDPRCLPALDYLRSKMKKAGYWQAQSTYILKNEAWVPFDLPATAGQWVSYEISKLMN